MATILILLPQPWRRPLPLPLSFYMDSVRRKAHNTFLNHLQPSNLAITSQPLLCTTTPTTLPATQLHFRVNPIQAEGGYEAWLPIVNVGSYGS